MSERVRPHPDDAHFRTMTNEVLAKDLLEIGAGFEHTRGVKTILFHPRFPVDIRHNSKIFREKLAVWAARRLGTM